MDDAAARFWTLAEIRDANRAGGWHFFDRATMQAFGHTLASFAVHNEADGVYLERVRPRRDRDGRSLGGEGTRWRFTPENGGLRPVASGEQVA